jgi:thioredoxin 1
MVLSVSERTFTQEVLESPVPVLVDFWAPWCGLCRIIEPVLLQFQASCGEPIKLVRVNADQNFKLSNTYRLTTLPTLILFEDGKVLSRLDNFRSSDELRRALEEIRVSYTDWRRRAYTGAYAGSSHAADWECRSA